jgi:soluble lytic murein transglycosylase-like protein
MTRAVLAAAFLLAAVPQVHAGSFRTWIDQDGVYHVDDTPQVTRTPSARKQPRGKAQRGSRWWERRSDAPPDEIDRAAQQFNIPAELIRAVIAVESAGDCGAVSHRGAVGLMQLMPETAGKMFVDDPVDPAQNILGGTRYLRHLANEFGGDMILTLAAYNAGPEAVRKYKGVPPYEETRQYVKKVIAYYHDLKRASAPKLAKGDTGARP